MEDHTVELDVSNYFLAMAPFSLKIVTLKYHLFSFFLENI